jgi:hypothetical protein
MFTSKHHLHENMGVDMEIATFFVDRKLPTDNVYWRGRYLYVAFGSGYLFIPLFFDLQYKIGVRKEDVLNEEYVRTFEAILHTAAMYEFEEIGFDEHIENCKRVVQGKIKNENFYADLCEYFKNSDVRPFKNLGTFSKALNRADTFLFGLCLYDFPQETLQRILQQWYALIPSFLLMDDVTDLNDDIQKNQENSISDFGPGALGIEKALAFLREKINLLKSVNEKLGEYFERSLDKKLETPYFKSLLNLQ